MEVSVKTSGFTRTDNKLWSTFPGCGNVVTVTVSGGDRGKNIGFCSVEFANQDASVEAFNQESCQLVEGNITL